MMLANNLIEILEKFDFTDSIVTEVKWAENLLDLVVIVDYYWDIQDGREDTRLLKLVFKNCMKVDFQISKELPIAIDETNKESLFTIILFKENTEYQYNFDKKKYLEIFTTDYLNPWLSVVCCEVTLEE
ncbi:hypothetical protein [Paenibacillus sp. GSMTC-2017]|uniref:hypothetical protein n=1 Tax=Paenibacillus sp. GSMTC-2017 TaxID=2794350 RepID=UPI001E5AC4E9|nr:hypothetical protein [Paenibacillus sp. GSMTC-2017]